MTAIPERLLAQPGGEVNGVMRVPGDKSISHRAVMFSALADGDSTIRQCLLGEDVLSTIAAFKSMGVSISEAGPGNFKVQGVGIDGLKPPPVPLDMGNSGTSIRLLSGILAGAGIAAELIGDASLSKRPMGRIIRPLELMGAVLNSQQEKLPLIIEANHPLKGIDYQMPVASAQVKSAVLLAGLFASGRTSVTEPAVTRDHTERMLSAFGVSVLRDGSRRQIQGRQRLSAVDVVVPGDISSAAFFMVGAAICPGAELLIEQVGVNPTRTGIIDILRLMGAEIQLSNENQLGDEPVADISVKGAKLHGVDIPQALVPLAIDEFPAIFVAAAAAEGVTRVTGAAELRVKESDRIAVMADGLQKIGVHAVPTADGIEITGCDKFSGGEISSHGDHRIAMAFAIAALRSSSEIRLNGCGAIATSFPEFLNIAAGCGLVISS